MTKRNMGRRRTGAARGVVQLMRPPHWVKNTFVFAPLFFTPAAIDGGSVTAVIIVFAGFCLVCSGVYCFNDYRDREADRTHPVKCKRPIAAGSVPPIAALFLAGLLVFGGLIIVVWGAPAAAAIVIAYIVLNLAYNFGLKRLSIVDVMVVSLGFVLRIYAGAAVIDVEPTPWIQICGGLLALFVAFAKRRDDLVLGINAEHRRSLSGYTKPFLDICVVVTLAAMLVSYLIFTLDDDAMARLGSDKIYLTAPYVLAGVFRYLQITVVQEKSGSPTELLFTDGFLIACVSAWLASYIYMIYI